MYRVHIPIFDGVLGMFLFLVFGGFLPCASCFHWELGGLGLWVCDSRLSVWGCRVEGSMGHLGGRGNSESKIHPH